MPLPKDFIPSRPYTEEDMQFLRDHYDSMSFDQLKIALNRNGYQVGHMLNIFIREKIAADLLEEKQAVQESKRPKAKYSNKGYW